MARRHPWLRAAYLHGEMVGRVLDTPAVTDDPNITLTAATGTRDIDSPDAKIGADDLPLDVVPDTPVSRRAHVGRSGITDPQQLVTYAPATQEFLREVFE